MNTPERVWIVIDQQECPQFVAGWDGEAHEHIADAINCDIPGAAQWVVREYRLHRPINWRTGVPDAEMVKRHDNLFALMLHDGSTLRECSLLLGGEWYWGGASTGTRAINPHAVEVCWCPEDEMPEGETT